MSWAHIYQLGIVPLRQEFCVDLVAPFALAAARTRSFSRRPVRRFGAVLGGRVLVRRLRLVNLHVAVVLVRGVERLENVLLVKVGCLGVTAMETRNIRKYFIRKPPNLSSGLRRPTHLPRMLFSLLLFEAGGRLQNAPLRDLRQVFRHRQMRWNH